MPAGTLPAERILEVRHASKYFGEASALRDVTLRFTTGESVLIYGPNGAGKTTLLRMLALLAQPSEGAVLLDGRPVRGQPAAYKKRIGFVSHATFLYDEFTVRENLTLAGKLFGLASLETKIDSLLDLFAVRDRCGDLVRTLSRGLQQRVTLARSLLHDPEFVLLDEPFTGLDAASAAGLEEILRRLPQQGRAVIFSNHNLAQGVSMAGRVVVMEKGKVRYDGAISDAAWASLRARPEKSDPQITQISQIVGS